MKRVPQNCRPGLDAQHVEQQRAGPSADQDGGRRALPISTLCHRRTWATPQLHGCPGPHPEAQLWSQCSQRQLQQPRKIWNVAHSLLGSQQNLVPCDSTL